MKDGENSFMETGSRFEAWAIALGQKNRIERDNFKEEECISCVHNWSLEFGRYTNKTQEAQTPQPWNKQHNKN